MATQRMRFDNGLDDQAEAAIRILIRRFETWCEAQRVRDADPSDFELILSWKINYGDGCLDLWTVADVDDFLLTWCPRKVSAPPEWALPMVESVALGFLFLGDEGLLARGSDPAKRLAAHARSLADECVARMSDSSNFGMAKGLFAGMGVDMSEGLSPDSFGDLIEQFNALPEDQRAQMLGAPLPEVPVIGPVLMPSKDEVAASASTSPVLDKFRALNDYFQAPGRPLTATGNIKLADAAALAEILGTEPIAEEVGERTFRRQSASRMPDLDHWQWWAREVGALRKSKSKLVGVKAWRDRAEKDPVGEARKAFEVLWSFGFISSYRTHFRSPNDALMDNSAIALLALPLRTGGEGSFEEILDAAEAIRSRSGVGGFWGNDREAAGRDLELILDMAQRAGLLEQRDAVFEGVSYSRRQVSGAVSLTPFGVLMLVEAARSQGVTVETIDAPEDLSAQALGDMLGEADMGIWWELLGRWLDSQQRPQEALAGLLAGLDIEGLCWVLLEETPDQLVDVFAPVLREVFEAGDKNDPVAAFALGWLAAQGLLDPDTVDPEIAQRCRLSMNGMVASLGSDSALLWGMDRSQSELLAEIDVISRTMPIMAVELLEAIGKQHPDKVVAKSARREVLKVRSRLANQKRS